jgi:hypothetical protein
MAATLSYFMLPEDEVAFFRVLAPHGITVYPELIPPGFTAPAADETLPPKLEFDGYYLAVERMGPVVVHAIKRGPDKGMLKIEEIPSPVFHYQRSIKNAKGELVSGRLWAELDITDDANSRKGKPLTLRKIFDDLHHFVHKSWRRSDPKGFWVGPAAAMAWKREKLVLREEGHHGDAYGVWR